MCVFHRVISSTHPLTHLRRKARGLSVCIYTYTDVFNKNTRQSRQSVRRCSANILFISVDGFSVLARVVVLFFLFFLFSSSFSFFLRKLKGNTPCASHNREHSLPLQLRRHHIPYSVLGWYSYLRIYSAFFTIVHCAQNTFT